MKRAHVAIVAVASVVIAGAGGALAASKLDSPTTRSQAIITDAAGQLNIDPTKLTDALQKAIDDQIDAAVKVGKLTPEQGAALKKRVDSGQVPLVGGLGLGARGFGHGKFGAHGFGFGFGHDVLGAAADSVATYLGITPAELRTELESGKTLAQIATAHDKTADGVVTILLDQEKQKLDKAVAAGFLTAAKEQTALAHLKTLLTDVVNGTLPKPPAEAPSMRHPGFGFARPGGFGIGPPPPAVPAAPASL
jgi:hypothetical protein